MIPQSVRESVLPTVDKLVDPLGLYCMYRLREEELVARADDMSIERAESNLKALGFEYHGTSAIKIHPSGEILDSGSYRLVPVEHPDIDARIVEEWEPEECHYHAHLFEFNGEIHLACHYEVRHDFFSPDFNLERLKLHYRPEHGRDYIRGMMPMRRRLF